MATIEIGYPQPATPTQTKNSIASGIMNGTIKQQKSKAIDMQFYWLKDRVGQQMFKAYWAPGKFNLADPFFAEYHPTTLVKKVKRIYLHEPNSPQSLQGWVEVLVES